MARFGGHVPRTEEQEADLRQLLQQVQELQPLPAVALRLIAMADDGRFSAENLADTVRVDPALTLRVLRLANSPFFGLPRRVTSLREGVVLLGFREVRALALSACVLDPAVRGALDRAGIDYGAFWINSVVVGFFAQALAMADTMDRDQAFTAGLVHNIGRLALAQHRSDALRAAAAEARATGAHIHEIEERDLGYTDAEVGAAIADSWGFPVPLVEAIANHGRSIYEVRDPRSLETMVVKARRFARSHGVADGLDQLGVIPVADIEWHAPAIERALGRLGGAQGILDRAQAYVRGDSGVEGASPRLQTA